jgi:two-component system chemotaxis response regulator CheB
MDGLTFLRNLMKLRPMPVVMISTLTEKGADVTLEALQLGAVDFVPKPKLDISNSLREYSEEITEKVRMAVRTPKAAFQNVHLSKAAYNAQNSEIKNKHFKTTHKIVALGSSTGGTEALKTVVKSLPGYAPAIIVSQHLPLSFSASFAKHVNDVTEMTAGIAQDGQLILPGNIYIAPGDKHLQVERDGARFICRLSDGEPVNRHKPSVEVMFRSVAQNVGCNAIGVMLTGMGADGAIAMREMRNAGAINIIQDRESSIVWGMPGEAFKQGAAHYVLPVEKIAAQILALAE